MTWHDRLMQKQIPHHPVIRVIALLAALLPWTIAHGEFSADECRPLKVVDGGYRGPAEFDHGLLWKLSRNGSSASFLFGTIHVADEKIVNLPAPVSEALDHSGTFVMEVVPDPEQVLQMFDLMYFNDEQRLDGLLSKSIYARTVEILSSYNLPEESIAAMKPWAAYLTMSYPPDMRSVLDVELLEKAQEQGAQVHGLESLEEQGGVFNDMGLDDQLQLLTDAVCHYDTATEDFERMKTLYLNRDLKGLYEYGQHFGFEDNTLYEKMTERLLTSRNQTMAERMLPYLEDGGAFVAIGAMHLPGENGVLETLKRDGFEIERVY